MHSGQTVILTSEFSSFLLRMADIPVLPLVQIFQPLLPNSSTTPK